MQFFALVSAVFSLTAMPQLLAASPLEARSDVCPDGLFSVPQCCSTVIVGVGIDCINPDPTPGSVPNFEDICNNSGRGAACCVVPIVGQALLCNALN
ncbi:hydrophobin [Mycena capillaripes]|nr:hydrophobin [Mycena capillaripes]KAJ6524982.1 hydrophobin [Mycena capillaripes]